jgi:hypothetical protein
LAYRALVRPRAIVRCRLGKNGKVLTSVAAMRLRESTTEGIGKRATANAMLATTVAGTSHRQAARESQ